jgi:hypothetical protein
MVELKVPEKKLLSEECWIELGDEVKIRIDYPTRSQEVELRRLQKVWNYHKESADTSHWMEYYLRTAIREVVGFSSEGKPLTLVVERGLAKELTDGTVHLDLIATLLELDLIEAVGGMIMQRLEMTEIDKKKFPSLPISSSEDNSTTHTSNSSPEPASSTVGTQSIPAVGSVS